jgi:predicted DsbA family dithiol-disulfide isomerase
MIQPLPLSLTFAAAENSQMSKPLKIDFVSDVACPWCAVGLSALRGALDDLQGEVQASLHFQPFELNPDMGPEGEDTTEHLARKYGASKEQLQANQKVITERGAAEGFTFKLEGRTRVVNTFNAHRLLHWAGLEGRQEALKMALFGAYFTRGQDPSDFDVLAQAVEEAGLNAARAREILAGDEYTDEVRQAEQHWLSLGINSVPAVIINDRHLIRGGQPRAVFEEALRDLAAQG